MFSADFKSLKAAMLSMYSEAIFVFVYAVGNEFFTVCVGVKTVEGEGGFESLIASGFLESCGDVDNTRKGADKVVAFMAFFVPIRCGGFVKSTFYVFRIYRRYSQKYWADIMFNTFYIEKCEIFYRLVRSSFASDVV